MNRSQRRRLRRAKGLAGVSLVATTGLLGAYIASPRIPRAYAMTLTVDSTADSGPDTLREAIETANSSPGPDTISITTAGTVTLQSPLPSITEDLTINGPGADQFTIDGVATHRVLNVQSVTDVQLAISDVTIARGRDSAVSVRGDEYSSDQPSLTLTGVTFDGNASIHGNGGALYGREVDTLTVSDSTFTGSYAYSKGGALIWDGDTVSIQDSTFEQNSSGAFGGAIYTHANSVTLQTSLFTSNSSGQGGGLYTNNSEGGMVAVSDSQFRGNSARQEGGAFSAYGIETGYVTIDNSTFALNNSTQGVGGAVQAERSLQVTNSTFTNNSALTRGGAIHSQTGNLSVSLSTVTQNQSGHGAALFGVNPMTVSGSIVQSNTLTYAGYPGSPGADISANGLTATHNLFTSEAYTSVADAGAAVTWNPADGNRFSANSVVGALGDNGGFELPDGSHILTRAPIPNSPVLNGVPDSPNLPEFDQRGVGFPRVQGGAADIGAVEAAAPIPSPTPSGSTSPSPSESPSGSPSPSASPSNTSQPTTTPTPGPTTSPTPSPPATTTLAVKARPRGRAIVADKRTTLVFKVNTDGDLKRVRTVCELHGQELSRALQQRLCGFTVMPKLTSGQATAAAQMPLRISVDPSCSTGLSFRVTLRSKADDQQPVQWSRTWRGKKGDPCRVPGTG